jgi:RAS protein activator-like 2
VSSLELKSHLNTCFSSELPNVKVVCINVYREADGRKKKERNTLVGYVQVTVDTVAGRQPTEKWYPLMNTNASDTNNNAKSNKHTAAVVPSIRVKAKYQSVNILPLVCYSPFLDYIQDNYTLLCEQLEQRLSARAKVRAWSSSTIIRIHSRRTLQTCSCVYCTNAARHACSCAI